LDSLPPFSVSFILLYEKYRCFQEERDAVFAKIGVSQVHLEMLKHTNVLNDAFYISCDEVIARINNFRLGRLPNVEVIIQIAKYTDTTLGHYSVSENDVQVEWDEINVAWGQAALLLHTMAHYFTPKFRYPFVFSQQL
jgi:beclin